MTWEKMIDQSRYAVTREEVLEQCRHVDYFLGFLERCYQRALAKRAAEAAEAAGSTSKSEASPIEKRDATGAPR